MVFISYTKEMVNFEEAAKNNDMIGVLVIIIFVLVCVITYLYVQMQNKDKKNRVMMEEFQKKNDSRQQKMAESEKELIDVLNGVSTILKLGEQAEKHQTDKILTQIKHIEENILSKMELIKDKLDGIYR